MYKIIVILILFQLVCLPLAIAAESAKELSASQSQTEKHIWQDERIGVTLDKVEIGKELSSESRSKFNRELPEVRDGYIYVSIYLTIIKVEGVYPVLDVKKNKWPVLYDKEGKKHKYFAMTMTGRPLYYSDDNSAPMKYKEWDHFTLLFQIPETSKPEKLNYIYYYRNKSTKSSRSRKGEIEIEIPKMD